MTLIPLNLYEFVHVQGPDARSFLQGQLSCNLDYLSPTRTLRGALCNLKGRVIADFRVIQLGDDCLLQTGTGMAEPILKTLGKYAVFSKVELKVITLPTPLGLLGDDWPAALESEFEVLPAALDACVTTPFGILTRVGTQITRYELLRTEQDQPLPDSLAGEPGELENWLHAEVRDGRVHVGPQLSEEFTPQLLNYDISGVIDFKKGCYTGQEIVARMYYRGKPKQRLFLIESSSALFPESRICEAGSDEGGEAVLAVSNGTDDSGNPEHLALAVLNIQAMEDGTPLHVCGEPTEALTAISLKYE